MHDEAVNTGTNQASRTIILKVLQERIDTRLSARVDLIVHSKSVRGLKNLPSLSAVNDYAVVVSAHIVN